MRRIFYIGIGIFLISVFSCAACGENTELEDKEFVMAVGIDMDQEGLLFSYDLSQEYKEGSDSSQEGGQKSIQVFGKSVWDLINAYGRQSDKSLDYNHMKAIVLGREVAENQEKIIELLQFIEKNNLFAQNVKVFVADNRASELWQETELGEPLGEYLEKLYENSDYYVKRQSCSVGELFTHWQNYDEVLLIPLLQQKNKKPEISDYAVMKACAIKKELSEEQANLVFLGNGIKLKSHIVTDSHYVIQIDRIRQEMIYSGNDEIVIEITLNIRGHVINKKVEEERILQETETAMEDSLNRSFAEFVRTQRESEMDYFRTFLKLSQNNKTLWMKYRNDRKAFSQNTIIEIKTNVRLSDD